MASQLTLFELEPDLLIRNSISKLSCAEWKERGAVYTQRKVVDFILDLMGYSSDIPLFQYRILEPCFGRGDFLFPIIERLLNSWRKSNRPVSILSRALYAVELNQRTFDETREKVVQYLVQSGISSKRGSFLADQWMIQGDFLLKAIKDKFSFIAGNPPYLRQERIPEPLLMEYRRRYCSMFDRADLYVPFIERSLSLLSQGGILGFICADRWMKNRYGGPLRRMVSENYRLKTYVDMAETQAFQTKVAAYPAITIISREKRGPTRTIYRPEINERTLSQIVSDVHAAALPNDSQVQEILIPAKNSAPWLLKSPDRIDLIRRLESAFPTLEEVGAKVGIGVATGADKVFIADYAKLDVEESRKLPLATTSDIKTGIMNWKGLGVINPFCGDGSLVDLNDYPKLEHYLTQYRDIIVKRHCVHKNPEKWYRTIDRIQADLTIRAKLLIPDIKGSANIVFDSGQYYPHHNLYYVISDDWDLRALQSVLKSRIASLFIENYSTQIRGGYLRFQAQYLRRIRVPFWKDVPVPLRKKLAAAAVSNDNDLRDLLVFELFGLTKKEISTIMSKRK
ncbi:MAG: TaqI-like C-terminal specificity domain-containing protein [Planctomycetia bacterium]|nr:TaqI-like C-terminal specificity domain-containing protein [Planctomycetia bacterium]